MGKRACAARSRKSTYVRLIHQKESTASVLVVPSPHEVRKANYGSGFYCRAFRTTVLSLSLSLSLPEGLRTRIGHQRFIMEAKMEDIVKNVRHSARNYRIKKKKKGKLSTN